MDRVRKCCNKNSASIDGPLGKHMWNITLAEFLGNNFVVVGVSTAFSFLYPDGLPANISLLDWLHHAGYRVGYTRFHETHHLPFLYEHILAAKVVPLGYLDWCKSQQCILSLYNDRAILFHDAPSWRNYGTALWRKTGRTSDRSFYTYLVSGACNRHSTPRNTSASHYPAPDGKEAENSTYSYIPRGCLVSHQNFC
jgi:hypothetical protein